ncbi:YjbF family lipoprotein [Paracoccus homiensis]|uniref:YjbF family lipoprotein n=1 Tax=Paracoccus homiensis TaxID=364199 RepID=UPI00398CE6DE
MNKGTMFRTAGLCALLAGLAACGNTSTDETSATGILGTLRDTVRQEVAQRREGSKPAAPAKTQQQRAAEALRVNPGPLVMVDFEKLGQTPIMAMTGQNGAMRTFMTPAEEALILRNGMLVGTRGLGNDLSVAEPQTEALIRAGRSGNGQRVMRYFSGDGLERPLQFDCTVAPGPNAGVMIESCKGHGVSFQNNYMVQGSQIPVSRQWVGPALGYVTIQTLRP